MGTELVSTLDADTLLHPQAVRQIVARLLSAPSDVQAVAGSVLVRNSRDSLWTRMQEWDYFLGIASVKRMQGLYQGTLVAQGAFSLNRTEAVLAAGGWPDAIGEDIVLTWQLMRQGARVYYEPSGQVVRHSPAAAECLEDLIDHEGRPEQALDHRQQVLPEPVGLLPEVH